MLRFRMDPKDDLSNRADFTHGLMQRISESAREAAEESPAAKKLKERADVDVRVSGSLNSVDIQIVIAPHEGAVIAPNESAAARAEILKSVNEAVKASMSSLLQESMKSARERS
jgi:hypothetical protein